MDDTKVIEMVVVDVVSECLDCRKELVTMEKKLVDDLGADSLDLISIIMSLEETFSLVEFKDEECVTLDTVGKVIDFIAWKLEIIKRPKFLNQGATNRLILGANQIQT